MDPQKGGKRRRNHGGKRGGEKVKKGANEIGGYCPKRRAAITAQSHNLPENVWPLSILVHFFLDR